ncbi:MAG: S9 family peptidase, partial [Gemmataceae bacterium]|nr:S9 family peptidase [Gemmataceae bacterium]
MSCLRLAVAAVFAAALAVPAVAADKRPMAVDDLFKFKRVAAPQISPDGKEVVYQVTTVDLEGNKTSTALWVAAADGKTPPKQATFPDGKKDTNPRYSPDGKKILFESNRAGGNNQLFVLEDGQVTQLTNISTGAGNGIWSPDGKNVAFVSAVYPEFSGKPFAESDKLNKEKDEAAEKNPVKAKVFTKLFYRHWVEYVGDKRQHLFVCDADGKNVRDVTPGDRDAYPTSTTFSSGDDFAFSPDGKYLVFTAVPAKDEAWSTNYDLCRVGVTNTSPEWETLTKDNPAADSGPKFSPDGKRLAWRAQKKPGYEADEWDILVVDCRPDGTFVGKPACPTDVMMVHGPDGKPAFKPEVSASEFAWQGHDGLAFVADADGRSFIHYVTADGRLFRREPLKEGSASSVTFSAVGRMAAFSHAAMSAPAEVGVLNWTGPGMTRATVSHANDALLAELDLPRPESVKVKVEGGEMQMWVLKPPGFDPAKKWPVAYLVHGGPQSAWEDGWSWRWNPELWAAQGYVVALPNPRGSTGFGQKFVDEISGDWGGKCYRDLVAGLDYVEALPYVDKDRIGAAGASFGGYMMDWFAVNDIAKRFKCLISHCSVWNFESMWGTTDELWFDEFEHGGLPWEIPGKYREYSPHAKAGNLGKYKVPMLVVHNDLDFRCPIGQGHELFSALQRQGVP